MVACLAADINALALFRDLVTSFSRFALLTDHYVRASRATAQGFGKLAVSQRENQKSYDSSGDSRVSPLGGAKLRPATSSGISRGEESRVALVMGAETPTAPGESAPPSRTSDAPTRESSRGRRSQGPKYACRRWCLQANRGS